MIWFILIALIIITLMLIFIPFWAVLIIFCLGMGTYAGVMWLLNYLFHRQ